MKKINFIVLFMCFTTIFCFAGCGTKELSAATITRDDARTGGSLSFVYDKSQKIVYVGGEEEVVQFSAENEALGLSEGNRIGLKVTAPDEKIDLSTAFLEMNGINYSAGDFLASINGEEQRFFNIYPLVSQEDKRVEFIVTWQDGTKPQKYQVEIINGTKFMDKDGNIK